MEKVMRIAPGGRCAAAGELAMLITKHDGPPKTRGHRAGTATEVEDLAPTSHDDSADGAVAQHPLRGHARNRAEPFDLALQRLEVGQRVTGQEIEGHDQLRARDRA
jgi:hypothetical protein